MLKAFHLDNQVVAIKRYNASAMRKAFFYSTCVISVFFERLSDEIIWRFALELIILIAISIARKFTGFFIAKFVITIVRLYPFRIVSDNIYMLINSLLIDLEWSIEIPWLLSCYKCLHSLLTFLFTLSPFVFPFLQLLGIHFINSALFFQFCSILFCQCSLMGIFVDLLCTFWASP